MILYYFNAQERGEGGREGGAPGKQRHDEYEVHYICASSFCLGHNSSFIVRCGIYLTNNYTECNFDCNTLL